MVGTRNFSKKEELDGQLGVFGPLCQEAGMQEKVSPRDLGELGQIGNLPGISSDFLGEKSASFVIKSLIHLFNPPQGCITAMIMRRLLGPGVGIGVLSRTLGHGGRYRDVRSFSWTL